MLYEGRCGERTRTTKPSSKNHHTGVF